MKTSKHLSKRLKSCKKGENLFGIINKQKHCKTAEILQQLISTFELISKRSKSWKSPAYLLSPSPPPRPPRGVVRFWHFWPFLENSKGKNLLQHVFGLLCRVFLFLSPFWRPIAKVGTGPCNVFVQFLSVFCFRTLFFSF